MEIDARDAREAARAGNGPGGVRCWATSLAQRLVVGPGAQAGTLAGRGPVFAAGPFWLPVNSDVSHLRFFNFRSIFCLVFLVFLLF
jgi:hypothetical protein